MAAARRDRGQALPLVLIIVAITVLTLVGAGFAAQRVMDRNRAQTAADAAALAGVLEGRTGASRMAAANGATLVSFARTGEVVTVTVDRHGVLATARATNGP